MDLNKLIRDCNETTNELNNLTKKIHEQIYNLPKVETCRHSYIPQGRLFCDKKGMRVTITYCEVCQEYESKLEKI